MNKKILVILTMILIGIGISAQVTGRFSAEIGYIPRAVVYYDHSKVDQADSDLGNSLYTRFAGTMPLFKYLYINGSVDTSFVRAFSGTHLNFTPLASTYTFGFGATYKNITIGYEYACSHPITPDWVTLIYGNGDYCKFFARYEITF